MLEAQCRGDIEDVHRCNYRFHVGLYRLADRPEVLQRVQTLWARFPFDMLTTLPGRMMAVSGEHMAVLRALWQSDAVQAGRAMRDHIQQGWQAFLRHYPRCPSSSGEAKHA
jgi:DNA-binding GntR family transcriptional regulator